MHRRTSLTRPFWVVCDRISANPITKKCKLWHDIFTRLIYKESVKTSNWITENFKWGKSGILARCWQSHLDHWKLQMDHRKLQMGHWKLQEKITENFKKGSLKTSNGFRLTLIKNVGNTGRCSHVSEGILCRVCRLIVMSSNPWFLSIKEFHI